MVETLQDNYKNQVVYQTNADYFASYEKFKEAESNIISSLDQTEKGLIWFTLGGTTSVFMLSPDGKMQVKWNNLNEKQTLLKIVSRLLVPPSGQELTIEPASQQAFISYPPPEDFKLYWCEEETVYTKKSKKGIIGQFFEGLEHKAERKEKKEIRKRKELMIEQDIINMETMLSEDEWTPDKTMDIRKKVRKAPDGK